MCNHAFLFVKNWQEQIDFNCGGDMLTIPVECRECGLKAFQSWSFLSITDIDGEFVG
jgi:hypothetical protein